MPCLGWINIDPPGWCEQNVYDPSGLFYNEETLFPMLVTLIVINGSCMGQGTGKFVFFTAKLTFCHLYGFATLKLRRVPQKELKKLADFTFLFLLLHSIHFLLLRIWLWWWWVSWGWCGGNQQPITD